MAIEKYKSTRSFGKRSADWNFGGTKWKLSRSKIDLFTECERCFYLDNKLGIARPRGPAFTLNIAVDALLKKEFDIHRSLGTQHPLMKTYKIDVIPYKHEKMEEWRHNFTGVQYFHEPEKFLVTGAIDDVWVNKKGELMVVDYKATSKDGDIVELSDTKWEMQYRRQMEIYQWLLRQNGFKVSDTGYFLYVNGKSDRKAFDGKLEFDVSLIAYKGNDGWIPDVLHNIKKCLKSSEIPSAGSTCEFCSYRENAGRAFRSAIEAKTVGNEEKKKVVHKRDDEKEINKKDKPEIHKTDSLF